MGIQSRPTAKGEVEGDQPGGCLLWGVGACSRGGGGWAVGAGDSPADG